MIKLFCDGSVNPQLKIGFGAYFVFEDNSDLEILKKSIKVKMFENTSSTKLELEVLLWALKQESDKIQKLEVYTDCQNILSLLQRREKLESNNFKTSTNKTEKNELLYKEFYSFIDVLEIDFIKIKGHKASKKKDELDKLFNLVDKASRKALRQYLNNEEK